jgi:bacterioferritin-associated ferredoxin
MYVCICRAVTDGQIRAAVEEGVTSIGGLRETLGCSSQCGKCVNHVKQIRDETLGAMKLGNGTMIPIFAAT